MSGSVNSVPSQKSIAVIGGGVCGLMSIKALKEEGLNPVCFEKTENYGGTWCYREQDVEGLPSVMWTTTINHSKEMGALSNHLFPKEWPNYMKHSLLYKYWQDVVEKFDLLQHIVFNHEVLHVKRADDYDQTGKWSVTVRNGATGEIAAWVFDGVMVCHGQFTYPSWPKFNGIEKFRGRIMHSHSLKRVQEFQGKKVVIVGRGCSGLDAATEISSVADAVYLSVRTPSWIISRVGPHGLPFDYCLLRRFIVLFQEILPTSWASHLVEWFFLDRIFNHRLFGIKPKWCFLARDPISNDDIGAKLLSGSVLLRNNIKYFYEDGVMFEGEDEKTEADVIIMATGYEWKFPFLEDGVLNADGDKIYLYKCMYPPQLKHHSLVFIGSFLPIGPGFPVAELQARWAAHVFSGRGSLPRMEAMMKDIDKRYKRNSQRYIPTDKISLRVDYVPYSDELSSQFGVKPNFWKMLFTDPRLFIACIFGPSLPYQYRLCGPHKWEGAREAILTAPERVQFPLMTKVPERKVISVVWTYASGHAFVFLFLAFILVSILSAFVSWKVTVICFFALYLLTILLILCKAGADVIVNRTFWR